MDNCTPVRINPPAEDIRFANNHAEERVWFRLDNEFKGMNRAKIFSGPADHYSYCAYDLKSAEKTFTWFAIAKTLVGHYPIWANQFDIWEPKIPKELQKGFFSLCFALGLAENRCVVTRVEADNPVKGAPEVVVENPLSANNPDSFWNTMLDKYTAGGPPIARGLVATVKTLYEYWGKTYFAHGPLKNVGLRDEPYFSYCHQEDFLTPNSGLIQIRKFAEVNHKTDLLERFEDILAQTKRVREKIRSLLVEDLKYF